LPLSRKRQYFVEHSLFHVAVGLNNEQSVQLFLLSILLFLVVENVIDPFKLIFRHVRHGCAELNIYWFEVLTERNIGTGNSAELPVSNNSVTKSEVVEILILAFCCVEELEDLVAFDINWLDVDELVIWPLIRIRVRGSVFRERVSAIAVTYFTEQDIANNWRWENLTILSVRGLW
jgi:hypothetical protein